MGAMPAREDYDFIGFTFGDKHSFRDLNIIRTSDGSRYNSNLTPNLNDRTSAITGNDGSLWFATEHKQRTFNIKFAYDSLTDKQLRTLRQVFNGKEVKDLIFDEEPYKVYSAKVTGTPTLNFLCFDDEEGNRLYKGEGNITFTCYNPHAHTPHKLYSTNYSLIEADGRFLENYNENYYSNKEGWKDTADLIDWKKEEGVIKGKGDSKMQDLGVNYHFYYCNETDMYTSMLNKNNGDLVTIKGSETNGKLINQKIRGDMPTYFKVKADLLPGVNDGTNWYPLTYRISLYRFEVDGGSTEVGNITDEDKTLTEEVSFVEFTTNGPCDKFEWDSKTGTVKAILQINNIDNDYKTFLAHNGIGFAKLESNQEYALKITITGPEGVTIPGATAINKLSIDYDYWYY